MPDENPDGGSAASSTNGVSPTRRRTLALLGGFGGFGLVSNRPAVARDGPIVDAETEFSVAILPDTQYYAEQDNGIFEQMGGWIADNRDEFNIETVLHEGDLVQSYGSNNEDEWDVARDAIGRIDEEGVPTLLALGNHDADDVRDPRTFRSQFPASRYERLERITETVLDAGTFNGGSENAYLLQEIHGERFLFVALEFGPCDAALEWAGRLMEDHAEATAVLLTHTYLFHDGTRTDSDDDHAPGAYEGRLLPEGGDYNNGEEMWRNELRFHENLAIVHSGHHIGGSYVARRADRARTGSRVEQLFMNYQTIDNGGDGWLRLLTIDTETYGVKVNTYSPHLDEWSDDEGESFEFDLSGRNEGNGSPGRRGIGRSG